MNIREELAGLTNNEPQSTEDLLAIIKKWAFEMVGDDFQELDQKNKSRKLGQLYYNLRGDEIKERIKEATNEDF